MNDLAYVLRWSLLDDEPGAVCRIVEFSNWKSNRELAKPWPPFQPSEPVQFETDFALLEDVLDYPSNNAHWPVMSRRMLDVLLSVSEFAYHEIPVTLIQDVMPVEVRYDIHGNPRPEYSKTDYVAVQLASYTDALDTDRSVYSSYSWNPKAIRRIQKLVLKACPEGLPPLFRMEESPLYLFVSADAKAALTSAGILGPEYLALTQL